MRNALDIRIPVCAVEEAAARHVTAVAVEDHGRKEADVEVGNRAAEAAAARRPGIMTFLAASKIRQP